MSEPAISQEMLNAAVKQAVKEGLLPKYATEEQYLQNWQAIKNILNAALTESDSSLER